MMHILCQRSPGLMPSRHGARHQKGTRTPLQTLELGSGACRDLAVLMIAGLRSLGIAARKVGIEWQRNFFDHRLRHDESETEKYDYILQNPVRTGLICEGDQWAYILVGKD